jgi:rhodanese-related sulfurtransferase
MPRPTYKDITPEVAFRARTRARLIDVRELAERANDGFIAGSEHVPLAEIEAACSGWRRDDELVLICRSGGRSARAAGALSAIGFARVSNMAGGMLAYAAAGLPVTRA